MSALFSYSTPLLDGVAIISWFCPCAFVINFSSHAWTHLKTDQAMHSLKEFHLFQFVA